MIRRPSLTGVFSRLPFVPVVPKLSDQRRAGRFSPGTTIGSSRIGDVARGGISGWVRRRKRFHLFFSHRYGIIILVNRQRSYPPAAAALTVPLTDSFWGAFHGETVGAGGRSVNRFDFYLELRPVSDRFGRDRGRFFRIASHSECVRR